MKNNKNIWIWILAVIFFPISLSIWFWRTDRIKLDKKQRGIILAVVWLVMVIISMVSPDSESDKPTETTPPPSISSPIENPTTAPSPLPTTATTETPTEEPTRAPTAPPTTPPTEVPTEPPIKVTEPKSDLIFEVYPQTVHRNETATVTIKGAPNTTYKITVMYKSGASDADGLEPKISDANGRVSWTWQIGGKTSAGTFTITVSGGGQSETVSFTIVE